MNQPMKVIAAIVMLTCSGCAQDNVKQAMDNLDRDCTRHYTFSMSTGTMGVGTNVTVAGNADCSPSGKQPTGGTP